MGLEYRPYGLLAELTYRCPLHCPYCSNPIRSRFSAELETEEWKRVIQEAAALGVLQIGFSGGEPLQRKDLESLVEFARQAGLYTNLITSGLGLTESRASRLLDAGLDNVQVSFQAPEQQLADRIAGVQSHRQKIRAAEIIKGTGIALSLNVVLHRLNIDCLEQIIAFAEKLGATRLELANTQYYGWAYRNRSILIPTRVQVEAAARIALEARKRLAGTMEILYVLPDYFTERPKPCMNGWGQRYLTVNPSGSVLPCPTAGDLPGLAFESVRRRSLAWIWSESESFNRFRGTEWMPDPCRSCPRKELDFGGCRCQAALLTGDPANTDPACEFSPYHRLVREAVENGGIHAVTEQLVYRQNP
jgi:pyrroloquinoline quinone biosynthesis protein E